MCPDSSLTLYNSNHPLPQPEAALKQCPAAFRPLVQRDLNAAWAAIATVTVEDDPP
jgi:hypothetical protein